MESENKAGDTGSCGVPLQDLLTITVKKRRLGYLYAKCEYLITSGCISKGLLEHDLLVYLIGNIFNINFKVYIFFGLLFREGKTCEPKSTYFSAFTNFSSVTAIGRSYTIEMLKLSS